MRVWLRVQGAGASNRRVGWAGELGWNHEGLVGRSGRGRFEAQRVGGAAHTERDTTSLVTNLATSKMHATSLLS